MNTKHKILQGIAASTAGQFETYKSFYAFAKVSEGSGSHALGRDKQLKAAVATRIKPRETALSRLKKALPSMPDGKYRTFSALAQDFGMCSKYLAHQFRLDNALKDACYSKIQTRPINGRLQKRLSDLTEIRTYRMEIEEIASECGISMEGLNTQCEFSELTGKLVNKLLNLKPAPIPKNLGNAWCNVKHGGHRVSLEDLVKSRDGKLMAVCKECYPRWLEAKEQNTLAIEQHKQYVQRLRKTG